MSYPHISAEEENATACVESYKGVKTADSNISSTSQSKIDNHLDSQKDVITKMNELFKNQLSALNIQLSALNLQLSTLNIQPSTLSIKDSSSLEKIINKKKIILDDLYKWDEKEIEFILKQSSSPVFVSVKPNRDINSSNDEDQWCKYIGQTLKKISVAQEIEDLSNLENDWDGYGAIPVLPECIRNAQNIIFNKDIKVDYIEDIYANPNGTISILWESKDNSAIGLEVGKEEMSYYVKREKGNQFVKHSPFSIDELRKLSAFIEKL